MQVSKYLNPMENQVFQFSVYNFHSMKTSLTKHVLLVLMGYKTRAYRWPLSLDSSVYARVKIG